MFELDPSMLDIKYTWLKGSEELTAISPYLDAVADIGSYYFPCVISFNFKNRKWSFGKCGLKLSLEEMLTELGKL